MIDTSTGKLLADLETFALSRDGATFKSPDFNFWGVTFEKDENRFYATVWSKGKTYLVECDLRDRSGRVLYDSVECPSLSPNNKRIAFKQRTGPARWRIAVLGLGDMSETVLPETRSVDDQVEWLDDDRVLYSLSESETGSSASTDLWVMDAHGRETPRIFLKGAYSPAVVR
jgi:hypothetical protein